VSLRLLRTPALCAVAVLGTACGGVVQSVHSTVRVTKPRPSDTAFLNPPKAEASSVPDLAALQRIARGLARQNGDPALHHGYIALTLREQAAAPDIVNSNQPVYQIVLHGHFTCGACSVPPGAHAPSGTWVTSAIDRETLQGTDFGITATSPSLLTGEPVYRLSF